MSAPSVSVVLPTYNHELFVERALRSAMQQDWPDLEVVVVDDGSSDGTRAVIERVLARERPCKVVYETQDNAGSHAALERAIELSSGEVIAVLNSDDYFDPRRLARLAPYLTHEREFLLFTGLAIVDAKDRPVTPRAFLARWYQVALRQSAQCPTVGFALLCNNICVTSGNLVFPRSLHQRIGGFRPFRYCLDWDFALRALFEVEPVFVPEVLTYYRVHAANTIRTAGREGVDEEYARIVTDLLQRHEQAPPRNPLAPCRASWPVYFPYFVRTHTRFDSDLLVDLIADPRLTAFPGEEAGSWRAWSGGMLELLARDDLGRLEPPAGAVPPPQLERDLLLRELALARLGMHQRYPDFAPPGTSDIDLAAEWARRVAAHPAPDGAERS